MSTSKSIGTNKKGEFVRKDSSFRNFIKAGGQFPPEDNRYHLYVSLACPWAHRSLIVRKLKGLENAITVTSVEHFLDFETGWSFNPEVRGCERDPNFNAKYLREIYQKDTPGYDGRVTVPVLFDKKSNKIVSNESSEIIRMLNVEMNEFCANDQQRTLHFYPDNLSEKIDAVNGWIYQFINNGVYRTGFAQSQEAYDEAVVPLFQHLDKVEAILSKQRYLCGDVLTEADIRLYTTLVRFDPVYHGHFKCNKKRIVDYKNMWGYLRDLYQTPGFGDTTDMEHICKHYQVSHKSVNPSGIVYIGPELDFNEGHSRASLK